MARTLQRDIKTPGIAATFRRRVAAQMEDYRERVAQEIKRQRVLHGQEPIDVAYKIGVNPRTYERWEGAETTPRLSNLRALAEAWGVEIKDLRPDLEAEAKQLERLEEKVDAILALLQK